jgi:hypothetical protein
MAWSRKFPTRLHLNDGRTLTTLADARDLMLDLPWVEQAYPHWQRAGDLLLQAAYRGRQDPIVDAGDQLKRALEAGGLLRAPLRSE